MIRINSLPLIDIVDCIKSNITSVFLFFDTRLDIKKREQGKGHLELSMPYLNIHKRRQHSCMVDQTFILQIFAI